MARWVLIRFPIAFTPPFRRCRYDRTYRRHFQTWRRSPSKANGQAGATAKQERKCRGTICPTQRRERPPSIWPHFSTTLLHLGPAARSPRPANERPSIQADRTKARRVQVQVCLVPTSSQGKLCHALSKAFHPGFLNSILQIHPLSVPPRPSQASLCLLPLRKTLGSLLQENPLQLLLLTSIVSALRSGRSEVASAEAIRKKGSCLT